MPQKHDPRPLPERIAEVLPDPPDGLTARAIGLKVSCRTNTVSTALKGMIEAGEVERWGVGKRGDPYIYSTEIPDKRIACGVAADLLEADTLAPSESVNVNGKPVPIGVDASSVRPWTRGSSDELPAAYGLVLRDVQMRARDADHERRMLDQVATLLGRIVDGEADR